MYLNKATIAGNLTRDPEMKSLPSGLVVTSFSVATNRKWKDKDGKEQEATEYHNAIIFGKRAEVVAKHFVKGQPIYCEGRIQTRSWDKDGVKQYRTEIVVDDFQFVGSKSESNRSTQSAPQQSHDDSHTVLPDYPEEEINPEDIPF